MRGRLYSDLALASPSPSFFFLRLTGFLSVWPAGSFFNFASYKLPSRFDPIMFSNNSMKSRNSSRGKSGIMTVLRPSIQAAGLFGVEVAIAQQAASSKLPFGGDCELLPLLILAVVGANERLNTKSDCKSFSLLSPSIIATTFSYEPFASPSVVTMLGARYFPCAASPAD